MWVALLIRYSQGTTINRLFSWWCDVIAPLLDSPQIAVLLWGGVYHAPPPPSLQHQFLNVIDSHRPLLALFREVRAEVTLTVEPLPEDRAEKEDTASSVSCPLQAVTSCWWCGSSCTTVLPIALPQASSGEGGAVGPESLLGVDPGWGTDQTEFDPPSKSRGAKPRHDSSLSEGRKVQLAILHSTC